MTSIPEPAAVQIQIEKGKSKDAYLKISPDNDDFKLEVFESSTSRWPKNTFSLKRIISEMKKQDTDKGIVTFITTEQEITFTFKTRAEAVAYHNFFCEKSEVHAENKAIAQLDDEMRMIWPFPGGSFF